MPIALPNLDDRTYADLVEEARRRIPSYAPEWTNHNASDPGITLIEMFAYLTEILMYRQDRVTERNMEMFLRLINGPGWRRTKSIDEQVRETIRSIRGTDRAVICEDFKTLALEADSSVARAECVPRRDLESGNPSQKPGHVSLVIVPRSGERNPKPGAELLRTVRDFLEPRRLVTTVVHVVGPRYVKLGVRVTLVLNAGAVEATALNQAADALRQFFHPVSGGPHGEGWPFGRAVYVSEIYGLLDKLSGVDGVRPVRDPGTGQPLDEVTVDESWRLRRNARGEVVAVNLQSNELVDAMIEAGDLSVEPWE